MTPEGAAYPPLAFVASRRRSRSSPSRSISGAIADRAKFGAWMIFAAIWATVVYFPVASWVFNFGLAEDGSFAYGGWITYGMQECFGVGAIDFAGGTAVHINAGAAALALALVLGKRVGFQKGVHVPHNPPFVLLGAGLLWFGWFGFNAGSELAADGTAALAFVNTLAAPAAALLAGSSSRRSRTASRPRSAPPPVPSPVSSRSPRPVRSLTPGLGDRARPHRRCGLRPGDRAEVQARLRRLARRGGHPPRRRPHRNAVPGLLRQRHRPVLQRQPARSCWSRRSPPSRC